MLPGFTLKQQLWAAEEPGGLSTEEHVCRDALRELWVPESHQDQKTLRIHGSPIYEPFVEDFLSLASEKPGIVFHYSHVSFFHGGADVHMGRSEESLQESLLSLFHVGPGDQWGFQACC